MRTDGADNPEPDELVWRWHDNLIYGISFDIGDPQKNEWRSDLILDIDFIAEWMCDPSEGHRFRVAPAILTFHNAGDLSLSIDHGDSDGRNAMTEWCIDQVRRERLERPFDLWRWTIELSMPSGGTLGFCSTGFTQTLLATPKLVSEQHLPRGERFLPKAAF